ncbi:MAG: MerR family DNA-binding protein [Bacteroidetes bacterium]|nr:MerR family DNA-binding protein [Bacteroidota bacterium]
MAAKSIGFTLTEIKDLIDIWYDKKISKTKKIEILNAKAKSIKQKIKELKQVRKRITAFIKEVEEFDC